MINTENGSLLYDQHRKMGHYFIINTENGSLFLPSTQKMGHYYHSDLNVFNEKKSNEGRELLNLHNKDLVITALYQLRWRW
jgi:hypothetical protein